jgi:hypothetical protein
MRKLPQLLPAAPGGVLGKCGAELDFCSAAIIGRRMKGHSDAASIRREDRCDKIRRSEGSPAMARAAAATGRDA